MPALWVNSDVDPPPVSLTAAVLALLVCVAVLGGLVGWLLRGWFL